jgi:putative hydrolase of the HAD superfamily
VPRFAVFDLFDTLVPGSDGARVRVLERMAEALDVRPEALVRAYRDSWPKRLIGWGVEETVRMVAGVIGARPTEAQVARAAKLRRDFAESALACVSKSTVDTLDTLRRNGYRLALISNATADSAEAWLTSTLAPRFDTALFSCAVGMAKPDPRIYRAAAARLATEPAQCLYVGDGADRELAGAAAVGMTVLRTTEFSDSDPGWPGATIASLAELTNS